MRSDTPSSTSGVPGRYRMLTSEKTTSPALGQSAPSAASGAVHSAASCNAQGARVGTRGGCVVEHLLRETSLKGI